jgi:cystathionine gamma-synthase
MTAGLPATATPATWCAQAGGRVDPLTQAVTPPLYPATPYARTVVPGGYAEGRVYGRDENPTFERLEAVLARLEGAPEALAFASGMAACTAAVLALPPGSHIVAPAVAYVGFVNWLKELAPRWGYAVTFYPNDDLAALEAAIRPGQTRMVWVETPGNPLWPVTDIRAAVRLAHGAGALLVVDNTVPTPVLTRPLDLGADLVVHSASKYLNGHHDVIAGAAMPRDAASDHWQTIRRIRKSNGTTPGPFEAWLLLRGMQTLFLRVRAASDSALALARHFEGHPAMERVIYPGLPSHPGHAIAASQMQGGFGGMLSLCVRGGAAEALRVADRVRVFKCATSLGGTESLIEHRATVEGEGSAIPLNLLRVSVGCEDCGDLIQDLEQALA